MVINENNKNNILKGMMKRGFNQDPKEIKEKFNNVKPLNEINSEKINPQVNREILGSGKLKDSFNTFRKLKWK